MSKPPRYSALGLFTRGARGRPWPRVWRDLPLRSSYDVVVVGGGVHGLATAYYLAANHGITDVADLVELFEDFRLDLDVLDDRLHDELAVGEIGDIRGRHDSPKRVCDRLGSNLFLICQAPQACLDRRLATRKRVLAQVLHDDRKTRHCEDLRDAVAHGAGADHAY